MASTMTFMDKLLLGMTTEEKLRWGISLTAQEIEQWILRERTKITEEVEKEWSEEGYEEGYETGWSAAKEQASAAINNMELPQ